MEKEENIVKRVCKELGLTYRELGEKIGYSEGAINNSSRAKVSQSMTKAIELYIKTLEQEKELKQLEELKTLLKTLLKD
jgi:transcriptional regulator with XRE-family HTH domain